MKNNYTIITGRRNSGKSDEADRMALGKKAVFLSQAFIFQTNIWDIMITPETEMLVVKAVGVNSVWEKLFNLRTKHRIEIVITSQHVKEKYSKLDNVKVIKMKNHEKLQD